MARGLLRRTSGLLGLRSIYALTQRVFGSVQSGFNEVAITPRPHACTARPHRSLQIHVWTAPVEQRIGGALTIGSGSFMCPASHEGIFYKLFFHRGIPQMREHPWRGRSSSKAELSLRQGTSPQTSHPAGRCSHHGPAYGTGELQEGGTTL